MESSEELSISIEQDDSSVVSEAVSDNEKKSSELRQENETEPLELRTDSYNKLLTQNKKILCELTQLNINEPTTSKLKTITAYTEEQLGALYRNAELDMIEDFTSHFVEAELKGVVLKQHPLYELLTNYLHVREKITGNTLEFNQLRKEYHECRSNLWTIEKAIITKQGQCQDGVKLIAKREYDRAVFHKTVFQTIVRILGNVQTLTNKNHVLYTFTAEDLKLQVFSVVCYDFPFMFHLFLDRVVFANSYVQFYNSFSVTTQSPSFTYSGVRAASFKTVPIGVAIVHIYTIFIPKMSHSRYTIC